MASAWSRLALLALLIAAPIMSTHVQAQSIPEEPAATDDAKAKASKARSPADAQKTLDTAAKSLEAGRAEQAIQQINALLSGPKLDVRIMARAMVIRGAAWRKQGKPAQAIADLTSALWLKGGLSETDRTAALAMRTEAYREAGLTDSGPVPDAKAAAGRRAETAAVSSNSQTDEVKPKPAPERTPSQAASTQKSGSGFFANLFGGGGSSSASTNETAERETRKAVPQPAIGSSWSSTTDVTPAPAKARTEVVPVASGSVTTASTASAAGGRYRVQVASVRSRAEAQALAIKVKAQHAAILGTRQLEVDETVIGNMGTFYRVRIGPFANAEEPAPLCAKLRVGGLDCLILAD